MLAAGLPNLLCCHIAFIPVFFHLCFPCPNTPVESACELDILNEFPSIQGGPQSHRNNRIDKTDAFCQGTGPEDAEGDQGKSEVIEVGQRCSSDRGDVHSTQDGPEAMAMCAVSKQMCNVEIQGEKTRRRSQVSWATSEVIRATKTMAMVSDAMGEGAGWMVQ